MARAQRTAVLFIKENVTAFILPFDHSLESFTNGWKIVALEPGTLDTRFANGQAELFAILGGDELVSVGDEIYLKLGTPRRRDDRDDDTDERTKRRSDDVNGEERSRREGGKDEPRERREGRDHPRDDEERDGDVDRKRGGDDPTQGKR